MLSLNTATNIKKTCWLPKNNSNQFLKIKLVFIFGRSGNKKVVIFVLKNKPWGVILFFRFNLNWEIVTNKNSIFSPFFCSLMSLRFGREKKKKNMKFFFDPTGSNSIVYFGLWCFVSTLFCRINYSFEIYVWSDLTESPPTCTADL